HVRSEIGKRQHDLNIAAGHVDLLQHRPLDRRHRYRCGLLLRIERARDAERDNSGERDQRLAHGASPGVEENFQMRRPGHRYRGAPKATGRTGEPAAPWVRSGRIMVHEIQTLSRAISPRLAFWMLWMPATARFW